MTAFRIVCGRSRVNPLNIFSASAALQHSQEIGCANFSRLPLSGIARTGSSDPTSPRREASLLLGTPRIFIRGVFFCSSGKQAVPPFFDEISDRTHPVHYPPPHGPSSSGGLGRPIFPGAAPSIRRDWWLYLFLLRRHPGQYRHGPGCPVDCRVSDEAMGKEHRLCAALAPCLPGAQTAGFRSRHHGAATCCSHDRPPHHLRAEKSLSAGADFSRHRAEQKLRRSVLEGQHPAR